MRIRYLKVRYYLALLFSLFCLIGLIGCSEKEKGEKPSPSSQLTALSAPTDLQVFGDELSWSAVENASGYLVKINNDKDVTTSETRCALKLKETENLDIRVYAVGDGIAWENSKAGTLKYKYEKPSEGLKYTKIEGGYEVAGTYEKAVGRVVIPDEYEGEPVIRIADKGFGESVFESGSGQMGKYWRYTSVRLPAGLKEIGARGFQGATSLTKIEFPKSLEKIGESAFRNSAVTSAEIPSGIKEIPYGCYFGTPITELKLPDGLEKIGESAFQKCIKLLNVTFPSSLKEIEEWAFRESGLTSVSIPSTVERLGKEAFADTFWYKLQSDGWMILGDGFLYGYKGELAADTTVDCAAMGVKKIVGGAFEGQTNLKKIVFSNETTEIGAYAFQNCTGLTEVVFPASVKTVGSGAFKGCTGLTEVVLPTSLTSVGSYTFRNCTGLKRVEICADIEGDSIFYDCTELSEVVLRVGITKIPEGCFSGCSSLQEVELPSTLESISAYVFCGTGLLSVTLPTGVKEIEEGAFKNCTDLTVVKMPSVTKIGASAFYGCASLKSLDMRNLEEIGYSAFLNCDQLTSVVVSTALKNLESYAFSKELANLAIYYVGTANEWETLMNNAWWGPLYFGNATMYFYVENEADVPTDGGKYWRYVDGVPTVWEV